MLLDIARMNPATCRWIWILLSLSLVCALYEDQIGKFDWLRQYVGKVEHVRFDQLSLPARRILVSTDHNVLAALSIKNGELVWRHILENMPSGRIDYVLTETSYISAVSGNLIRTWDVVTAALRDEMVMDLPNGWSQAVERAFYSASREELVAVYIFPGTVHMSLLDLSSGNALDTYNISVSWISSNPRCAIAHNTLVCLDILGGKFYWNSIQWPKKEFKSISLFMVNIDEITQQEAAANPSSVTVETVDGSLQYLLVKIGNQKKLIHVHDDGIHLVQDVSHSRVISISGDTLYVLSQQRRQVTIQAVEITTGSEMPEQGVVFEMPDNTGLVELLSLHHFERKDGSVAMRALISCSDHSIHLIGSAGVIWSREEALSSTLAAEAIDLPISGDPATFHDLHLHAGILGSFVNRIQSQVHQAMMWVKSITGQNDDFTSVPHSLVRDQFNIRKLLVVVTASGKVISLDNWSGDIVWSLFIPELAPMKDKKVMLYVQRSSSHFPYQPQCVIFGLHKATGNGLLYSFNPLTGEGLGDHGGLHQLDYIPIHVSLLHHTDRQYLKPLMLIDGELKPHVYPESAEGILLQHKNSIYVHLARQGSSTLKGYSLFNSRPQDLTLTELWSISLSGNGVITGIYGKSSAEKVHSPGRVMADRSVLYKYINPNFVVVTTQGYDSVNKNTLNVHLVDTVTGTVLESVTHKRIGNPIHVVHSENWVVYTCYNERYRRHEITTLELFEGLEQANATAFSSFYSKATPPIVERQAFIMQQGVRAAAHTTTEKGITTKFILLALESGNVLQVSKWMVDPRRPISQGQPREEGLVPYIPELHISSQEIINYNKTLPLVTGIYTAPTGLESTCIILLYGLDVFYTRLFPSKMFDVLKDDFDHFLIVGALVTLGTAALVTRKLSQRKALKQAWK